MKTSTITEHYAKKPDGTGLFYLASGPEDGPLVIFVHGWPELSVSWRHQLPTLGALGFRAIAPDMPGYGRSTVYKNQDAYSTENLVKEMLFLIDSLGAEKAVWVGHDWGSPVAWAMASHHPDRCHAVASLCVPFRSAELGLQGLVGTVDRSVYPADIYPAGQWEYMLFYEENFAKATAGFDINPVNTIKALFRRGDPDGVGKPAGTAEIRRQGSWFGEGQGAPDLPLDEAVLSVEELHQYASALTRNGFFGPDSYYMNHERNADYGRRMVNGGYLDMPALFILADYDFYCECNRSALADEMRKHCRDLTTVSIPASHWVAQEKPVEVNAALVHWLATEAKIWPKLAPPKWGSLRS
jgi:pimeloyl-ACP methyl ester carboxylesterase